MSIRLLSEALDMAKYSKVVLYKGDQVVALGEGETVFVLRAQDELAWQTVEYYAELLAGVPGPGSDPVKYQRMATEVRRVAGAMRRYKVKKMPD